MCKTSDLVIMVVEPDKEELRKACDSLNNVGINRIICIDSFKNALIALNENKDVDIVIADFQIEPDKALGLFLCSMVKKHDPGITFILISKEYTCSLVLDTFKTADDLWNARVTGEIENMIGKWIQLAKVKNEIKGILYGSNQ